MKCHNLLIFADLGLDFALIVKKDSPHQSRLAFTVHHYRFTIADTGGKVTGNKFSRSMKNRLNKICFFAVFPIVMVFCGLPTAAGTVMEPDAFPVYDSIRPNISFWEKI